MNVALFKVFYFFMKNHDNVVTIMLSHAVSPMTKHIIPATVNFNEQKIHEGIV